jgi:hypothetical protein
MPQSAARRLRFPSIAALGAAGALATFAPAAQAHVKWFSKVVNCVSVPLSPLDVITAPYFITVYIAAVLAMAAVFLIDKRLSPRLDQWNDTFARQRQLVSQGAAHLLRVGVAIYFASLLLYGGDQHMILTPELLTSASWVPMVQRLIALTVLWRRTAPIAAAGIVALFAYASGVYGLFHMADYPYFLGIALFLLLDALYGLPSHVLGFAALRLSAGASLLWVSVEKWMYPTWAYDILNHELRQITMGIDTPFFVMSAGFVEFCLAFLLLFGRLSSQVSALVLLVIMVSAIPLVGSMDAVGHAPLLIALLIFTAVNNRIAPSPHSLRHWSNASYVFSFAICVPGLMGLYYLSHLAAYPDLGDWASARAIASALMGTALAWRVLRAMPHLLPRIRRAAYGGAA